MATIYLIRHGQASFGQDNYDKLSPLGEQQATHLGNQLARRLPAFDAISLGTMTRHQQTAEHCLAAMGLRFDDQLVQPDAGWNEYDHQNILAQFDPRLDTAEGTQAFVREQENPAQAFEEVFNGAVEKWIASTVGEGYRETWTDFTGRIERAFRGVIERNPGANRIAVFTSGGPISLLSLALLDMAQEQIMQINWRLVNCGVTKLVNSRSRTFLATLNEHVHFEGEHQHLITYK